MGQRGPQKTPTAILKARGSRMAFEQRKNEPQGVAGRPEPSMDLDSDELVVWEAVCDRCAQLGTLSKTDAATIARYAVNTVRWEKCRRFIQKHGEAHPVYDVNPQTGEKTLKMMRRVPQSRLMVELDQSLLRIEREFGLTPSARAGLVGHIADEEVDPLEDYLRRRTSSN